MLVLSILFVPILVLPLLENLTVQQTSWLEIADNVLWACFAAEYFTRLRLARDRVHFVATNLIDLAVVALPLLRPLRVVTNLRLLQASRIVIAGFRGGKLGDKMVNGHSVTATAFVLMSLTTTAAALVYHAERFAPDSKIHTVGDAFWWAVVTVSTVGYGDYYPITTEGRVIAAVLMFVGVSTSALIAAAFASMFIKDQNEEEFDPKLEALATRLDQIDVLLIRLEGMVAEHERKSSDRAEHSRAADSAEN